MHSLFLGKDTYKMLREEKKELYKLLEYVF